MTDLLACGCPPMADADHAPDCDRNHWPHDACSDTVADPHARPQGVTRGARWRLYGLPGGRITARMVARPATVDQSMGTAYARADRIEIMRPPELPRGAVALLEYRDAPDARRSPRYDAAIGWAVRTFDL